MVNGSFDPEMFVFILIWDCNKVNFVFIRDSLRSNVHLKLFLNILPKLSTVSELLSLDQENLSDLFLYKVPNFCRLC